MAKKRKAKNVYGRGMGTPALLRDRDWMTIIGALLSDRSAESHQLAAKLLAKTKHGRQIRLLRFIIARKPKLLQMQKTLGMSRRTIFRYLNGLEDYGVRITMGEGYRYGIENMPLQLKRLM